MWDYRLVKDGSDDAEHPNVSMAEVYYNEAGEPYGWCDAKLIGEDLPEVAQIHRMMGEALIKPILEEKDIRQNPEPAESE